jgi:Tol biopolymer transport system component
LKRIDTTGGAAQVLANAPLGRGGSWNTDDVILYSPSPSQGIWRVSAMGGTPTAVTLARSNDGATRIYPHFLADGRRFIYYLRSEDLHRQGIYVSSLDAAEERMVIQNNGLAVAGPGQIVLVRDGMLFAQAVDEATMQTRGNPVRIADGVGFSLGIIGYSPIAVGGSALAFGPPVRSITALQWHERNGKAGSVLGRGEYRSPRVSPDGRRVALTVLDSKANSPDVWTMDLARGALSRVSHDSATDWFPAWSPDSLRVYFGSGRSRSTTIYVKATAANEPEQQVIPPTTARYPLDVTSEGVLFQSAGLTTESSGYDLGLLTVTEPQALRVVVSTPFNEVQARVSPNGRWMAYASDESGRYEVYVRDFPAGRDQVTISRTGGMQPEWRGDGRELFFVSADRQLMSVAVSGDAQVFSAQLPRPLFAVDLPQPTPPYPNDYAVSADGQRFLINTLVEQPLMPITVVLNWRGQK